MSIERKKITKGDKKVISNKYMNLKTFLEKYDKIVIPDIQRDYVMGSGEEYLRVLFEAMNASINKNEKFSFSCIMGYAENINNKTGKKCFYVYDGQQRLTTLVYILAYLIQPDIDLKNMIAKYKFIGRNEANEYLMNLLNSSVEEKSGCEPEVCDFTTYSMKNLLFDSKYGFIKNRGKINAEFILNDVIFSIVSIDESGEDKKSDAEQFFLDLNDGVDLKEYEIYKAELNHYIGNMNGMEDAVQKWALKMDNEWLTYFLHFKQANVFEEELEVKFIQYCFYMIYVEKNGFQKEYNINNIQWIEKNDILRVYSILNMVIKYSEENIDDDNWLNYCRPKDDYKDFMQYNGAYWNLKNNSYRGLLDIFIKSLNDDKYEEVHKRNVLVWCFLTTLLLNKNKRDIHLRFIKKLLNNNRIINDKAYFSRDYEIYFCRYCVYGIPVYYGINLENYLSEKNCNDIGISGRKQWEINNDEYLGDILKFNYLFCNNDIGIIPFDYFGYIKSLDNRIFNNENFIKVMSKEISKYDANSENGEYNAICALEDKEYFNGLIDNALDEQLKIIEDAVEKFDINIDNIYQRLSKINIKDFNNILYDKIKFYWPVYNEKLNTCADCSVIFQTKVDFLTCKFMFDTNVFQKWISGQEKEIIANEDLQFFLQYYKYLPKGCYKNYNQICYPYTDEANRNFLTERGAINKKGQVFKKIESCRNAYSSSTKKIYLGSNSQLYYENTEVQYWSSVPYSIKRVADSLRDKLLKTNKYGDNIKYYEETWMQMVLIDKFVDNKEDNKKSLINYKSCGMVCFVDKYWFYVPSEAITEYVDKYFA